jgi:hypothetical protein
VFLLNVEREFPTITLFQPLVKYKKYSFNALEYYTREIQTIIKQLQTHQKHVTAIVEAE